MKKFLNSGARILEGMGMALDSVRANKVRAALTILGVAIGVMVVIAMASAITGINRAVSAQLETLGPKTFFVFRFFQGGLNISDGSDEMSPWRRNPWLTTDEAALLRSLPTVRDVGYRESTGAPMAYGDFKLSSDWSFLRPFTLSGGGVIPYFARAATSSSFGCVRDFSHFSIITGLTSSISACVAT